MVMHTQAGTQISVLPAKTRATLAGLPGPRGWPLLGNAPQIDSSRMHTQLEGWADEFGPLYRLRFGPRTVIVVARPDLISTVLRERPDGWRRMSNMQAVIHEMGGHGVFAAEGDDWRRQRRLVMAAFDPGTLKRYFPALVRVTQRFHGCLQQAAASGTRIDLQALLMRYTVDVTASLAFGTDINTLEQHENAIQSHLDKVFPMLIRRINAPFPYWRHIRLPADRAFDRHLAKVHEAAHDFLRATRERMERHPALRERPTNLLEALLAARDEAGIGLSTEQVVGNVLTVLLAGEDTTANTLGWTLHLLHGHPAVWRALVAEADTALGENKVPVEFETTRRLRLLEACVNEAMRLRPVAPVLFFESNRDNVFDGMAVPSGTPLLCLMRKAAVDTDVAADATAFRPARWLEAAPSASDAAAAGASSRALLKASLPFGAGPRLCPGRYLALLETKLVLATIARNFELVDVSAGGEPPEERFAFTMFPAGLQMRLAPRRFS